MIVKILIYLICAIIAVPLLIGIFNIIRSASKMTKSESKSQFRSYGFFRLSAVFVAFVMTIVFCGVLLLKNTFTSSAVITLNYAEASLGQNANKTRYNMDEIICDDVIEIMIKKGGFRDVSVSDFNGCFSVTPLVEGDVESESDYHISTEFVVEYEAPSKMRKYPSDTVVSLLCDAYRDYYVSRYAVDFDINDNFEKETESLDYYDKVTYLSTETNQILNFLYGLQRKSSSFVSTNGETFDSAATKVYNLKEHQINNELYSFILQNGISKDANAFVDRLKYDNKQNDFDRSKSQAQYDVTNEAVAKYAEEMATAVLVPTRDENGEYYMGRTKVGVDELSLQASDYSDEVADCSKKIENNNLKINYLLSATGNTDENRALADQLIEQVHESVLKFAEEARTIGREYYATQMNKCISATVSSGSVFAMWQYILAVFVFAYVSSVLYSIGKNMKRHCREGE